MKRKIIFKVPITLRVNLKLVSGMFAHLSGVFLKYFSDYLGCIRGKIQKRYFSLALFNENRSSKREEKVELLLIKTRKK